MILGEIRIKSEDIITIPEAAKRLGRPKMTLYRWLEAKKIIAFKLGGIFFVPITEVQRIQDDLNEQSRLQAMERQEAAAKKQADIERLEIELRLLRDNGQEVKP